MDILRKLEIDRWFAASMEAQPPATLAVMVYVEDGKLKVGREGVYAHMRGLPDGDLESAMQLVDWALKTWLPKNCKPDMEDPRVAREPEQSGDLAPREP